MSPLPPHAQKKLLDAATPLADPLAEVDLGRYQLVRELGRGGMGVVYAAFDRTLGRRVALKVLFGTAGMSDDARARFLREAQAAARLSHPNIAAVYDATPDYIAMQLVEGRTLAEVRWEDARLLAALVRDAALAVHAAHQQGIVHRDLKPANLMVEGLERREGAAPHVYVMDFGLAKETAVHSALSTSGSILGTPEYMSPEQAAGRGREVDARSDVHALGATLYACLAGRAPFAYGGADGNADIYELIRRTVEDEAQPLERVVPAVDRELATIVAKCLAKEPEQRYPSALALAGDLDRWLRHEPIQARPPSVAYRLQKYFSRRRGALKAGGLLAVIAAGLVALIVIPPAMKERAGREAAEQALELSGRVSQALSDAALLRRAGDLKSAQARLDLVLADTAAFLERTETSHARFFQGSLLRARGKWPEARAALDRALAANPGFLDARFERGLLLAEMHRDELQGRESAPELEPLRVTALGDLDFALAAVSSEPSARAHYAAGHRAWLAGDALTAEDEFKEVTRIDKTHAQAHLSLSMLYLQRGNTELARYHSLAYTDIESGYASGPSVSYPLEGHEGLVFDFGTAGAVHPGTPQAYARRAQTKMSHAAEARGTETLQRWEEAIADLDVAIGLDPAVRGAWVNRGLCHYERDKFLMDAGDMDGALAARRQASEDLSEALRLDPNLAPARFDQGLLYKRMGTLLWLARRPLEAQNMWLAARSDFERAQAALPQHSPEQTHVEAALQQIRTLLGD